jgi:hypothetical protein
MVKFDGPALVRRELPQGVRQAQQLFVAQGVLVGG